MRRVLSLALILACASSQAPPGFLAMPEEAQREARGGWIVVHVKGGWSLSGELLAVSRDEVDVLESASRPRLLRLHFGNIESIHFEAYRTQAGRLSVWTSLGAASTIGNGVYLVFTAPLFVLVGALTAAYESRAAFMDYPGPDFADAWKFARFPQGLPANADECLLVTGTPCSEPPDAAPAPDAVAAELPDAAPPPADAGPPPPDAYPRPRRFEFISAGPYHQSGQGEWVVTIDRNELRIAHHFRVFESREIGPLTVSDDELRELWTRLAGVALDALPALPKNAPDESTLTLALDGRRVRVLARDAQRDPALRKLLAALERLVERYAGEHPSLR